jgi:hypothetical protein
MKRFAHATGSCKLMRDIESGVSQFTRRGGGIETEAMRWQSSALLCDEGIDCDDRCLGGENLFG